MTSWKNKVGVALTLGIILCTAIYAGPRRIMKTDNLKWRMIPEHKSYPTDDIIVAGCAVDDPEFNLPKDPSSTDCTAAFQAALDAASASGGGTVFVPKGRYRIDGSLMIGGNVTLRGRWREITAKQKAAGTILCIYTKGKKPTLNLIGHGCGVRDLTFWHPEQKPDEQKPAPFPFVIAGSGRQTTIENITLINAYNGIDMSSSSMCCLRGIYGSPLNIGLTADQSYAVSRFDSIHFSPEYWVWSGAPGKPSSVKGKHSKYMRKVGIAVDIREMDGFYMMYSTISGYNKGLQLREGVRKDDPWGSLAFVSITDCNHALHAVACKSIKMIDSTFQGDQYGITVEDNSSALKINNCTIEGGSKSIVVAKGGANLVNCKLVGPTEVKRRAKFTESSDTLYKAPTFSNKYPRVRKPGKPAFFNVKDFGASGNGRKDDTAAVKKAVSKAVSNGGGIVFFPNGKYIVKENLDLGAGVELRGSSGGRHVVSSRKNEELGSVIMIDVPKGNPKGTAFITMGDQSGLRGIGLHYVHQHHLNFIEYPFMVRANGTLNYIIDCFAGNPYQAVEFNGDDHLLEYTFFGGLKCTYRANNCKRGRIQNCHIKPDFWGDTLFDVGPWKQRGLFDWEATKHMDAIYLKNCSDYSLSSIYSQYGRTFVTVDNSSGKALVISAERFQHGYSFKGAKTFDLLLAGCTVNCIGDNTGTSGIRTSPEFKGKARFFGGSLWGTTDDTYDVNSSLLYLQQCTLSWPAAHGAMNMICGTKGSIFAELCTFKLFMGIDNKGAIKMKNCDFQRGIPDSVASDYEAENKFTDSYVLADMNGPEPRSYGLELDNADVEVVDALLLTGTKHQLGWDDEVRRVRAVRLKSGKSFKLDVTSSAFSKGLKPQVDFEFDFFADTDCQVKFWYDSLNAGMKLGHTVTFKGSKQMKWKTVKFSVPDARFNARNNEDIRIEVVGPCPRLAMATILAGYSSKSKVTKAPPRIRKRR